MPNISKDILKNLYPERENDSHKYEHGYLMVVGGSKTYSGSPALAAMTGMRSGLDLNLIVSPKRAADVIATYSPDLITYPLEGDYFSRNHLSTLVKFTEQAKQSSKGRFAVVIGGGMEKNKQTSELIREYLRKITVPAVIDADAIQAVSGEKELLKKKRFVITPHSHEFLELSGENISSLDWRQRAIKMKKFSKEFKTTLVLKGSTDIISDGNKVFRNKRGNPFLTVGGTGDTLAGIIGALLAKGNSLLKAGCGGAYINGVAGELASREKSEGVLATDLIDKIPEVVKKIKKV